MQERNHLSFTEVNPLPPPREGVNVRLLLLRHGDPTKLARDEAHLSYSGVWRTYTRTQTIEDDFRTIKKPLVAQILYSPLLRTDESGWAIDSNLRIDILSHADLSHVTLKPRRPAKAVQSRLELTNFAKSKGVEMTNPEETYREWSEEEASKTNDEYKALVNFIKRMSRISQRLLLSGENIMYYIGVITHDTVMAIYRRRVIPGEVTPPFDFMEAIVTDMGEMEGELLVSFKDKANVEIPVAQLR